MTFGPAKHEIVARSGGFRLFLGFWEHAVRSIPWHHERKIPFDLTSLYYMY